MICLACTVLKANADAQPSSSAAETSANPDVSPITLRTPDVINFFSTDLFFVIWNCAREPEIKKRLNRAFIIKWGGGRAGPVASLDIYHQRSCSQVKQGTPKDWHKGHSQASQPGPGIQVMQVLSGALGLKHYVKH